MSTLDQQPNSTITNSKADRKSPTKEELDLLVNMVEIPSPSHHEAKLSAYLVDSLKARGFHAYQDDVANAVGIIGSGEKTIILLGHMDTVPGDIRVRIEEGKLFGRGAVDAKGPLACFICAASRLRGEVDNLNKKIILIAAVEEEAATSRGAHEALRMFQSPNFCLIGEPSSWDAITLGYKGRLLMDYELKIPMKHTAAQGKLVCEETIDFWNQIKDWCQTLNDGKGRFETVDPTIRSFNSENNGIYERAKVKLGFRLPVDFPLEDFTNFLLEAAGAAQLNFSGEEIAVRTGKSNPLVKSFLQSIRAHQGSPKFKVKTGTSDMNVVALQWNCPLLAYGPGDSSLDHTPHEHIEIEEYGKSINVLESVLRTI